jgi:hypothetical protein
MPVAALNRDAKNLTRRAGVDFRQAPRLERQGVNIGRPV